MKWLATAIVVLLVLPLLILTWFAVRSLEGERLVTENLRRESVKRILTECAGKVQEAILPPVETAARALTSKPPEEVVASADLDGTAIEALLVARSDGTLVAPRLPPADPPSEDVTIFAEAERAEFQESDPAKARALYEAIATADPRYAPSALLRAARCAMHTLDSEVAKNHYLTILREHAGSREHLIALYQIAQIDQIDPLTNSGLGSSYVTELVHVVEQAMAELTHAPTDVSFFYGKKAYDELAEAAGTRKAAKYTVSAIFVPGKVRSMRPVVVEESLRRWEAVKQCVEILRWAEENLPRILPAEGVKEAGGRWVVVSSPRESLVVVGVINTDAVNEIVKSAGVPYDLHLVIEDARGMILGSSTPAGEATVRLPLGLAGCQVGARLEPVGDTGLLYPWLIGSAVIMAILGGILAWTLVSRQVRLSRMKTDFVASVTHELKTPLTSIRMFTEMMLEGRIPEGAETRESLEIVSRESERLSRLINKVLTFGRMETGKRKFTFEEADLADVVEHAVKLFDPVVQAGECEVTLTLDDPPPPPFAIDRDGITEVLVNLIENGIKYSKGKAAIAVRLSSNDGAAVIAVSDKGVGIPHRALGKIFDKFYRVDDLLARETEGCGLGLTIAKYIVEAHGGVITVVSEEGKGSTFAVSIPVKQEIISR